MILMGLINLWWEKGNNFKENEKKILMVKYNKYNF